MSATFHCNLCGAENEARPGGFARDEASCAGCGSTVRLRALLRALSVEIFGIPLALFDFPVMKSIRGLGLADDRACAARLAEKFDYRNTYYHQAPSFDVSEDPVEREAYDFVLAGDIFEHVAPPVESALANVRALLKPHGFLAMTVPYGLGETTAEHFPEMHEHTVVQVGDRLALVNRTAKGEWQLFDNLVFHGGHGSVLELRVFGEADLRRKLSAAGFSRIEFTAGDYAPFGITHRESWSLPIVAGNEPFRLSAAGMGDLMGQYMSLLELKVSLEAELLRLQGEFEDRTRWALELEAEVKRRAAETAGVAGELNNARFRLALWEASRWTHLGRALGLGPKLP